MCAVAVRNRVVGHRTRKVLDGYSHTVNRMKEIATDKAPASIGPFSQAIRDGETVYVSGQGPVNPDTGAVVSADVSEQTARTMENIDAVLHAAGGSVDNIVKATVFVRNMDMYDTVNEVYADYLSDPYPARSAVEVRALPIDIEVEIEVVASIPE